MTRTPNLTTLVMVLCAALAVAPGHAQETASVVTLRAEATINASEVLLGAVADIQAPAEITAKLAAVSLSSAPLAGASRVIAVGYVQLRLRRFGFDPGQVEVHGDTVTVRRVAAAGPGHASAAQPGLPSPVATAPVAPLVRRGQVVEAEVRCGAVAIHAAAVALSDGAIGDLVSLRRDSGNCRLTGRVAGPGRVVLILTEGAS